MYQLLITSPHRPFTATPRPVTATGSHPRSLPLGRPGQVERNVGEHVLLPAHEPSPAGLDEQPADLHTGACAAAERGLVEVAIPYLEDFHERTQETVHFGLSEGHEVVYVAKIDGHRQAFSPSRLGGRMPLHTIAIGKALLALAPPEVLTAVLAAPLIRRASRPRAHAASVHAAASGIALTLARRARLSGEP